MSPPIYFIGGRFSSVGAEREEDCEAVRERDAHQRRLVGVGWLVMSGRALETCGLRDRNWPPASGGANSKFEPRTGNRRADLVQQEQVPQPKTSHGHRATDWDLSYGIQDHAAGGWCAGMTGVRRSMKLRCGVASRKIRDCL